MAESPKSYQSQEHLHMTNISIRDIQTAFQKDKEYGSSWKKRGGVGAFMMLARKMDRLEEQVKKHGYDIFAALREKGTSEALIDTMRDLRVYLSLVENEAMKLGIIPELDKTHYYLVDLDTAGYQLHHDKPGQTIEVELPELKRFPSSTAITEHPAPFGYTLDPRE